MRVGILADVHLHRHDHADDVRALIHHVRSHEPPDLLVLAGDISHRSSELRNFLSDLAIDCHRCWVPGNHDVWVIDPEFEGDTAEYRYRLVFPRLSAETGWHYLPDGPLLLEEQSLGVVGTMGWFTGSGYSEWYDRDASEADERLAVTFADDLEEAIAKVPGEFDVVVVTHHVSHRECPCCDANENGEVNGHLHEVFKRHRERIVLALHGHKHVRHGPTLISGLHFMAHPFGYPHQHSDVTDGYRIVELSNLKREPEIKGI